MNIYALEFLTNTMRYIYFPYIFFYILQMLMITACSAVHYSLPEREWTLYTRKQIKYSLMNKKIKIENMNSIAEREEKKKRKEKLTKK